MKHEKDPVVEEVQRVRRQIFKEFDYDPRKLGRYLEQMAQERKAEKKQRLKQAA